jgi:glutamate--cysteine ligase
MTVRDTKDVAALAQKACSSKQMPSRGAAGTHLAGGVLTLERMNDAVAEPVVYMMDRYVVGGFYRVHAERAMDEELNAPGSSYVPLAFDQSMHSCRNPVCVPGASAPNRFYMYGVIGRLAMLAASYELEATDPEAEIYD